MSSGGGFAPSGSNNNGMSPQNEFAKTVFAAQNPSFGTFNLENESMQGDPYQTYSGMYAPRQAANQDQMSSIGLQTAYANYQNLLANQQYAAQNQAMKQQAFNTMQNLLSGGFYGQNSMGGGLGGSSGYGGIGSSGYGVMGGTPMIDMGYVQNMLGQIPGVQTNYLQGLAGGPNSAQNQAMMNQALMGQQQQFKSSLNNLGAAANRGAPVGSSQAQLSSLLGANLMGNAYQQQANTANSYAQQLQAAQALASAQNMNMQSGLSQAQLQAGLLGQNLGGAQTAYNNFSNGLLGSLNSAISAPIGNLPTGGSGGAVSAPQIGAGL